MAAEKNTIPVISVTTTDDASQVPIKKDAYNVSPEPLTDVEDLDHDKDHTLLEKLKIQLDEEGGLTDAEVLEGSDDDLDSEYVPKTPFELADILDYGATYEELITVGGPQSAQKVREVDNSGTGLKDGKSEGLLDTFYEKDGVTDYEDYDMSDEEDNVDEEGEEAVEDYDILNKLIDDESISISDQLMKSPVPSPVATPEPGGRHHHKKGRGNRKSKSKPNPNLLSPRSLSPHLSDITDTEIVYSDSDDENSKERAVSPQERRRRNKLKEDELNKNKKRGINTELSQIMLPEISSVVISEKIPVKEMVSESDTEYTASSTRKPILYPKKKTLLMEVAGALMKETFAATDVEQFEGSNDSDDVASLVSEYHYDVNEGQSHSVRDKQISKRLGLPKQYKIILTDTEDIETDEDRNIHHGKTFQEKNIVKEGSTEEDEYETTDAEYLSAVKELRARAWKDENYEIQFVDINGQARPLAITPDIPQMAASHLLLPPPQVRIYTTDTEDLDSESDYELPTSVLSVHSPEQDGGITDTEMFEGEDEILRPKSPEPIDEENSQILPEPIREMILVKEDSSGRPVSVVLPLGNIEPDGLKAPQTELDGTVSEVEDMMTDDEDALTAPVPIHCVTPDIFEIDGGVIQCSEVMKIQKKTLKLLNEGQSDPLTDTEDIFLSGGSKRKRSKAKLKLGIELKQSNLKLDLTDTEELVSDVDSRQTRKLIIPVQAPGDPVTDLDDVDYSGEDDNLYFAKSTSQTPDHLREIGDSYTTLKDGSEPFSDEARQNFLSLSNIPRINTISPSPDLSYALHTDTEDMFTSADEDGYTQAETMTPYEAGLELEDNSSVVYMKHTRKFDLDAPEEAIHVKGGFDIHDSHTDVEDLVASEDERPKPPDQLFVNDTVDQVCVCLGSEVDDDSSVCVCVSKEHGGLSLVWNSKNSTDAKHHRDWAEKGKPDSTVDPLSKESEEALLDLAAGVQDIKGSGAGPSAK